MSHTDPIADMLIRIKNAYMANHAKLTVGYSRIKEDIAVVLKQEGYLRDAKVEGEGVKKQLVLSLMYVDGQRAFTDVRRLSKPGLRKYSSKSALPTVLSGVGQALVSTSKGVMSVRAAKKENLGGELICEIW
ncbi:30S ribosomal protein S8 [Candidatus Roizmanbacteria bacterium CG22_combo_CG10-13_8_21_14_all_38_20]|uniref:Small ribosomal subunit protein uS8 n=1 Tax=Candidatus Roizmanbacteria bacterium CG22_combo_CG10-13_8_21_14_all_38_20 TaxID=1974862 RepID=A0A2H0BWV6_9BACT|nr:30S ribosomal protein S8 [Candidatus Microgenomates bacterium]PIP62167.1 MAG: 30S ribosomal protein S8 [Candidatus Roizmanbacteria bacterium CG22_combo_CG10-13_8_21_14_all_38_20]PJC30895.1 MAG: 30S ribosomal protein S8 [Candidatus Roizmanbacteria bacterium CG_4_9_14_0_2_um_filter_38_17]